MTDGHDNALLRRAATLGREAEEVLADLGLPGLFEAVGETDRVGSISFGLALGPDIDFNTLCPVFEVAAIWEVLRPLAEHPRVKKVRWTDERGPFNSTGQRLDDGIYCGVHYHRDRTIAGERWKLDCWFFPWDSVPRPEIEIRDRLMAASDAERLTILRLKDEAMRNGRYGPDGGIVGFQIYEAVLDRGVRTYRELLRALAL